MIVLLLLPSRAVAAVEPVDIFGGWSFQDVFPDMYAYAQQFYNAMGPMAWLVGGIFVATLAVTTIIDIVRAAVSRADHE